MMRRWTLPYFLLLISFAVTATAVPVALYGLNYNTRQGPDWDPNKCKSREQVLVDLTVLQRLTSRVRILSLADCGQGEIVMDVAKELGLKVMLGLWVSKYEPIFELEKSVLASMLDRGLIDDMVIGITVGSEAIYREDVTIQENIDYMVQVKDMCVNASLADLPVSIVDIAPKYNYHPELTAAVDVVVTNSFPFWESVPIENATDYLIKEIYPIKDQTANQNRDVILGETGWPGAGSNEDVGVGSPELQTKYFTQFFCRMDRELNWKYYYFSGLNNDWRQELDPDNTIEGTWGFLYADLTLKPHFANLAFSCPGSPVEYTFSEIDWTIPTFRPTDPPVASPTASPAPTNEASCQAHTKCAALSGNCCPTDSGGYLGCCDASPTKSPTQAPTKSPVTQPPTFEATPGTTSPTQAPTQAPTESPTKSPVTQPPTFEPTPGTTSPTQTPTKSPVTQPLTSEPTTGTASPTQAPTKSPTQAPTIVTMVPTVPPTKQLDTSTSPTTASPTTPPTEKVTLEASVERTMPPTSRKPIDTFETSSGVIARQCATFPLIVCCLLAFF